MPSSYFHRPRRQYKHAAPVVWYKDFSLLIKILPPIFLLVVSSAALLALPSQSIIIERPPAAAGSKKTVSSDGESVSSGETSGSSQENAAKGKIRFDWNLILVNTESPLPDDYTPPELANFGPGQAQCDARIKDDLEQMLSDAASAGHEISVLSDYRSVEKQTELYENKVDRVMEDNPDMGRVEAEAEAAKTVAYPGTSEHHTGLAFDIASEGDFDLTERFAMSEAFKWLEKHCTNYGFIIRYPDDKVYLTGINYEPWHYRYVGKEHADEMMRLGFCLEEYIDYLASLDVNTSNGASSDQ